MTILKNRKALWAGFGLLVVLLLALSYFFGFKSNKQTKPVTVEQGETAYVADYKEGVYKVDDHWLKISAAEKRAPGEAEYINNEWRGDVSGDGWEDVVFWFRDDTEGSGTFYYVTVALNTIDGFIGTKSYFVGDRIKPISLNYQNGEIVVEYKDRAAGEPMAKAPTEEKKLKLHYDSESKALELIN